MAIFERKIILNQLDLLGSGTLPWLDDLFRFWAPAGSGCRPGAPAPLRFAVRNTYANFYASGQSIARLSMKPKAPVTASVHQKYLESESDKRALLGPGYKSFGHTSTEELPTNAVANWIAVAAQYSGAEKTFVERLTAANPNVIDVEMTLPAPTGSRSAVRMDLVVLEPAGEGWKLEFWEAKMANNPEARAKGDGIPKVVDQQNRYREWLNTPGRDNKADVLAAYRNVCRDLVAIHDRVAKSDVGANLPELGEGIIAVANDAPLALDDNIRLIIDNSIENESFESNGHRAKLADTYGIHVQVVPKAGDHRLQAPAT